MLCEASGLSVLGRVSPAAKLSPLGLWWSQATLTGINFGHKEAIAHAIKGEPKASKVTAKKDLAHHPVRCGLKRGNA